MNRAVLRRKPVKITLAILASLGLVIGGAAAGVAIAGHTTTHVVFGGGGDVAVQVATDALGFGTSTSDTWEHVTGSTLKYTVPSGAVRLIRAEFTAESSMSGGSWCAVRIVAKKSTSSTLVELYPRAGTEFAFDAPGGELYEGNALKRAGKFGAGTWSFTVQGNAVGGGSCYLDDWYFDIEGHSTS